jgi:predicted unusual protein kinase regulating ubiquinone biosynthesis (AarF/ABC1/UbiB family)
MDLDRRRYRQIVRFFAGAVAHFILWEIVLRRILGRKAVERTLVRRWQRIARRYRLMAIDLGGVLIKLGQFLSVRVDVLPRAVTAELSGLQDEVPAEELADVLAVVEAEYARPAREVFAWFAPQPEAAASLAQVHRARLHAGDEVVAKVQRPRIQTIVETDLRAIQTAAGWLKRYGPIRRRVDLDRLYDEFASTTRRELDFVAEAENARRFAANFQDDPGVRVPRIYADASTGRVLVMENVAAIKIADFASFEEAGIRRKEVSDRLFDTYLRQLFVHNFLHADPHPGNLFVQPLPGPAPGEPGPAGERDQNQNRPFRLVFVDFGMVAIIPERMRPYLKEILLGFATGDAGRTVRAYQGAGFLLPGADLARLEQMEAETMERFAGLTLRQAQQAAMNDWQNMAREYRDILYQMPFQLPTDLLFVGRAVAILSGMATSLDPDFDPWQAIEPFAQKMAAEEARRDWRGLLGELEKMGRLALTLPGQADRFFQRAVQGELTVRSSWTPEASRTLRRLEAAIDRLAGAAVFAALLLSGVAVYLVQGAGLLSTVLLILAGLALLFTIGRR